MMKFFSKKKNTVPAALPHEQEVGGRVLRDWGIVIGVFAALVLIAIAVDGYLLLRINQGNFFTVDPEATLNPETINRKTLLNVSDFFDTRQKEYEAFKSTTTPQIDPSL